MSCPRKVLMNTKNSDLTKVPNLIEGLAHPRDQRLIAFGKSVVARLKVCLASGETNNGRQITRSVICFHRREQSLSTVVRDHCRASEQNYDEAYATYANGQNEINR